MAKFKVFFGNGKHNGAERYYGSLTVARRVASRYVRGAYRDLSCGAYCEIFMMRPTSLGFSPILVESVDIYSLKYV